MLTIGELAALAGRRPSSIRYYEQIGLLPQPTRVSGQRRYDAHRDAHTVRTLAVIDTAQRAGLTLDEVKALLSASSADGSSISQLREVADRKLAAEPRPWILTPSMNAEIIARARWQVGGA